MKESIYLNAEQFADFLFEMTDETQDDILNGFDVDNDGEIDLVIVGIELVEK